MNGTTPDAVAQMTVRDVSRFVRLIDRSGQCWTWTAAKDKDGYGLFKVRGKMVRAHRVAVYLATGKWPGKSLVCHVCDNPSCVNDEHLFIGTPQDNSSDMVRKGRSFIPAGESHPMAQLTAADVQAIRRRVALGRETQAEIAADYGITHSNVSAIARRKSWRHVP